MKTVTTRTVQQVPVGPDGLPLEGSPVTNNYVQTMDRNFRKNGSSGPGSYVSQAGTVTLPRNYHYPDGYSRPYDDGYPGSDHNYGSLSRVTRIDERYRPSMDGYRAPSRQEVYGPQPQVRVGGSNMDLNRFHAEPYGLEDDQRSVGYDDMDYGLMSDYGTARRAGTPSDPRRRLRYLSHLACLKRVFWLSFYPCLWCPMVADSKGDVCVGVALLHLLRHA